MSFYNNSTHKSDSFKQKKILTNNWKWLTWSNRPNSHVKDYSIVGVYKQAIQIEKPTHLKQYGRQDVYLFIQFYT